MIGRLKRINQYIETARYLKPIQITARIRYKLIKPRPNLAPAPRVRSVEGIWQSACRRHASMTSPTSLRLMDVERDLNSLQGWSDPSCEKLWLYNLHYFDDLNSEGRDYRTHWHTALIERWIKENPPAEGIGWEPYPISMRLMNWIKWSLEGHTLSETAIQSMAVQARYLEKRMEFHLLGNHLLENAKALIFAGLFFDGVEADRWLNTGLKVLEQEVEEEILEDGGHFELSPMYHSIVLEDMLDLFNLTRAYPNTIASQWRDFVETWGEVIEKQRLWLQALCHPDGDIALFNDATFGVAIPPKELEAYARRLFFDPVAPPHAEVTSLLPSGYVRLQNHDAVLLTDVGMIGADHVPGHAHADILTFELSLFGKRFVVNSGTSTYEPGEERIRQRSTPAHNTVVIDGKNSSEVWGSFRVAKRARPIERGVETNSEGGNSVSCGHDGYKHLPGRILQFRKWTLNRGQLRVEDRIEGRYSEAVARFHLHPDVRVVEQNGSESCVLDIAGQVVTWSVEGGAVKIEQTTYHPALGVAIPNSCLVVQFRQNRVTHTLAWGEQTP